MGKFSVGKWPCLSLSLSLILILSPSMLSHELCYRDQKGWGESPKSFLSAPGHAHIPQPTGLNEGPVWVCGWVCAAVCALKSKVCYCCMNPVFPNHMKPPLEWHKFNSSVDFNLFSFFKRHSPPLMCVSLKMLCLYNLSPVLAHKHSAHNHTHVYIAVLLETFLLLFIVIVTIIRNFF